VRTLIGNNHLEWSWNQCVIERNSVWFAIQRPYAPNSFYWSFSVASAWKSSKNGFAVSRNWNEGSPLSVSQEISQLGCIHDSSDRPSVALWSKTIPMHWARWMLYRTWADGGSRTRGWGWTSARANWLFDTATNRSQVYVFFGHMDPITPPAICCST
jgi:hypothetical protein